MNLTVNFQIANAVPANGVVYFHYPSQIGIEEPSLSCNSGATSLPCVLESASEKKIRISGLFPSGEGASASLTFNIVGLTQSLTSSPTSSFKIYTYTAAGGYLIDKKVSGLTLTAACDFPCQTCSSSDPGECLSCIPTATQNKL